MFLRRLAREKQLVAKVGLWIEPTKHFSDIQLFVEPQHCYFTPFAQPWKTQKNDKNSLCTNCSKVLPSLLYVCNILCVRNQIGNTFSRVSSLHTNEQ